MATKSYWKFVTAILLTALIAGVGLVPNVAAITYNTINVDCNVDTTTPEWQTDEAMGGNLYITWDSTNLYIGIKTAPLGNNTIYIDNGSLGGGTTASFDGSFQIAVSGGYEYSFTNQSSNQLVQTWNGISWTTTGAPTATSCLATGSSPNNKIEWAIPWSQIGNPSRITILVVAQNPGSTHGVIGFWPNAGNNESTTPSFDTGYIFSNLGSGVSPNSGTPVTAIALNNLTARNATSGLALLAGVLVLSSVGVFVLRRRQRNTEI